MRRFAAVLVLFLLWGSDPTLAGGPSPDGVHPALLVPAIDLYRPLGAVPVEDQDYDLASLGFGAVWLDGTAWVSEGGAQVVIAGHNPGAFSRLGELRSGDVIYIIERSGVYVYRVTGSELWQTGEWWRLASSYQDPPTLTLLTCWGTGRLAVYAALERVGY